MSANSPPHRITAAQAGQRLDVAVGLLFPDYSARARRRLWDSHRVLVNGTARPCGFMVKAGDELSASPIDAQQATETAPAAPFQPWLAGEQPPHIVAEQQNLIFLYKPSGLHSAHLAGRGGPSLEALLPDLLLSQFPDQLPTLPPDICPSLVPTLVPDMAPPTEPPAEQAAEQAAMEGHPPHATNAAQGVRLVNRLDCGTSGLVVAARDACCAALWQRMENAGLCDKHYLALLCGRLTEPIVVRNNLDVDSRRVTKVLPTESTNSLRHSRFSPIGTLSASALRVLHAALSATMLETFPRVSPHAAPEYDPSYAANDASNYVQPHSVYTVALCTIAKGARHQIRAHASHAGFPLWGDGLYAAPRQNTQGPHGMPRNSTAQGTHPAPSHHFLLHHGRLVLSGAVIQCLPVWFPLLPPDIQAALKVAWPISV